MRSFCCASKRTYRNLPSVTTRAVVDSEAAFDLVVFHESCAIAAGSNAISSARGSIVGAFEATGTSIEDAASTGAAPVARSAATSAISVRFTVRYSPSLQRDSRYVRGDASYVSYAKSLTLCRMCDDDARLRSLLCASVEDHFKNSLRDGDQCVWITVCEIEFAVTRA